MKQGHQPRQLTLFSGDFPASDDGPFRWLDAEEGKKINGIYGRTLRAWSPTLSRITACLRTSLESSSSRLTMFVPTWSVSATTLGYGIMKLRLSERRTGEQESFLWRTPKATDSDRGQRSEEAIKKQLSMGGTIRLQDQVNHPKLFRTPDAGCARGAQSLERFAKSVEARRLLTLNDQVAYLFPTPRAADGMAHPIRHPDNIRNQNPRGRLEDHVALFPTPTANDSKNNNPPSQRKENGRHSDQLNVVAGGALNPEWVGWLMGFPSQWTDIGHGNRTSQEPQKELKTV